MLMFGYLLVGLVKVVVVDDSLPVVLLRVPPETKSWNVSEPHNPWNYSCNETSGSSSSPNQNLIDSFNNFLFFL